MKKESKDGISTSVRLAVFVTSLLVITYVFLGGYSASEAPLTLHAVTQEFAECLAEKGVVMYGSDLCPHCNDQKEIFGEHFKHINYVNCEQERETCIAAGVTAYPTWVIEGIHYRGTKSIEKLAELSGCELV